MHSILRQPHKAVNIIVIDDGSIDGSSELCDKLALRFDIIDVIHQRNAGVASARNAGINYVLKKYADNLSGHYIAFLDADDVWEESFLDESVLSLIDQEFDLIGFQSCTCNQILQQTCSPKKLTVGIHQGGANNVWMHAGSSFAAMLYSCNLLHKYSIRFQSNLRYSEDKIFSIQCMYLATSICLQNRLMYLYRINSTSAMQTRKFGISYFEPIIYGYLEMDMQMEAFATEERGILCEGKHLATHYIMDMISEHYQCWGSKKSLDTYLSEHPELIDIVTAQGQYKMLNPNSAYEQYTSNPIAYIISAYFKGAVFHTARCIWRIIRKYI